MPLRCAFTLVELLVVVTIIAILLSLLTPTMDRAVYLAELARCAAQQKGIATGANAYAVDFKRFYPDRPTFNQLNEQPLTIAQSGWDDRPVIRDHIPLKGLVEPLAGDYDIGAPVYSWVFSGFELWFGTRYQHPDANLPQYRGFRGMKRLGDRFEWNDDYSRPGQLLRLSLDFLSSDFDFVATTDRNIAGHPDSKSILAPLIAPRADEPNNYYTRWEEPESNGIDRGPLDLNYSHADGHVERINEVEVRDDRVASVPYMVSVNGWSTWRVQLPMRQ